MLYPLLETLEEVDLEFDLLNDLHNDFNVPNNIGFASLLRHERSLFSMDLMDFRHQQLDFFRGLGVYINYIINLKPRFV